jgi:hypothetical protein
MVAHDGEVFEVQSASFRAFDRNAVSAVCISRNIVVVEESCFSGCHLLHTVGFEGDSHLGEIAPSAFFSCVLLTSIAIPSSVGLLGRQCFYNCTALESVSSERPSRLLTIEDEAFLNCRSLNFLSIPASMTSI